MIGGVVLAVLLPLSAGCTAAYDNDGDWMVGGPMTPPLPKSPGAVPVVVDSDLAPDDLVSLAYLMRHPDVDVLAVTVPTTGLVTCPAGVDLATDLMVAVGVQPVPVSCGTTKRGKHGIPFPSLWSMGALTDNGLSRDSVSSSSPVAETPPELIARLADEQPGLTLVALGPMTEVAATLRREPAAYERLDRIVAMTGVVEGPPQDDTAGEWNAAADPDSLAEVLAGPVPVVVVPNEVAPIGPPAGMRAPVVGMLGVATSLPTPRFWDLATVGYFTTPDAGETTSGSWSVALTEEPGRLTRSGSGPHTVVTALDATALDAAYARVFGASS